ncbi:MAG: hypothetical protein VXZ83_03655, partial [Verrucomicrobiota bacterium]|nr:hypothetical protein [Verrucomicrobiota bacterium]
MKKKTSLIVALSSITVCALFAVPSKINYQGLITDTAGEPIESSTNTVTVTLYQVETDGTSVYTESFTDVASDADGLYSIQIGDTNLQAVLEANSELWLELTINEQTLSPRQEINSVPYALVADSANRLINASDSSISGNLSVSGNSTLNGISVTGPASLDSLSVGGFAYFNSAIFDDITVMGPASFSSSAYFNGISVMGPASFSSTASFNGISVMGPASLDSLSVSGNSILNGVSVTGPASLDTISVMSSGYFGGIEVSGTATFSGIDVNGSAYFGPGIMADYYGFHAYNPDVDASSYIGRDPITGNYGNRLAGTTIIDSLNTSSLNVSGTMTLSDVSVSGTAVFTNASSVTVPEPSAEYEATNKAYVDNLVSTSIASNNAKGLVQLAVTENVSNLSEYYLTYESGGSTLNPAQGDLVLLTGQTTASENGIYEVSSVNLSSSYSSSSSSSGPTASDYYVSLTRASNFDSAEELITGSFVFVEKGAQVGQGYVLGELASGFALGTSALNYIQFTVDTTIIENNSENITTAADNISNNTDAISILHGRTSVLEESSSMWTDNADAISILHGRTSVLEGSSSMWTDNADAIAVLQSDVDQNESDADTAIADIKTGDTVFSGSPSFTGVKPLPSGQTDYTSNYYELQPWNTPSYDVPNFATVNVDGLLNADVINAESMLRVGNLYITENEFRSDYGQVNIDNLRTHSLDVSGDIMFDGYRADFEMAEEVRVPTPDQDNEATNKAYVDNLVSTSIASDNAKGLVQLAVTENVSNLSEYYLTYESGGSTLNPAQGD